MSISSAAPPVNGPLAPFLRHIRACNDAVLPGDRIPFHCKGERIGWVTRDVAEAVGKLGAREGGRCGVASGAALTVLSRELAALDVYAPLYYGAREEMFDVRDSAGHVLGQVNRGAIPVFGFEAEGVHLNGLVEGAEGTRLWITRRSRGKRLDPGKLDHLVAGGIPSGLTPEETLVKEAYEEAGIPDSLARRAKPVGEIHYAMERPEGLRRDVLHCYDLILPADFRPLAKDGEVESFALLPLETVFARVRDTDDFKFNVNLVLIDLFIRRGLFAPEDAATLRAALDSGRS